jgi:hypothetical protein
MEMIDIPKDKAGGGTDNITFQLTRISHSPHRKSVFESMKN